MSDLLAPTGSARSRDDVVRASRLDKVNRHRTESGKRLLTEEEFRRRGELEAIYRDSPSAAARDAAAAEMARQDRAADEPPPASPEVAREHIQRIRRHLGPLRLLPKRDPPQADQRSMERAS